jgi:saccharopine dehydrogenase-like NADP-dependent oxidoreductase
MRQIVVVGAGKIGQMIAAMLAETGDYRLTVVDRSRTQLDELAASANLRAACVDIADAGAMARVLRGAFAVVNAGPFHLTATVAQAAAAEGVHYLDLTEDVAATRRVRALAADARSAFVPQCGLAPGFVSIVANDLAGRFDSLDSVRMRVGALPEFPSNALNYNLTWSTDGVINEYCEPCEAIVDGALREVPALEDAPLRARLRENAARDAQRRFALDVHVDAYTAWYRDLAETSTAQNQRRAA